MIMRKEVTYWILQMLKLKQIFQVDVLFINGLLVTYIKGKKECGIKANYS